MKKLGDKSFNAPLVKMLGGVSPLPWFCYHWLQVVEI